jgi:hypothetical protein
MPMSVLMIVSAVGGLLLIAGAAVMIYLALSDRDDKA